MQSITHFEMQYQIRNPIQSHSGISSSNGSIWHTNRRFSLRYLRDQGMGKSRLVPQVHQEAHKLVERLKQQADKAEPVPQALKVASLNVIWYMIAGKLTTCSTIVITMIVTITIVCYCCYIIICFFLL